MGPPLQGKFLPDLYAGQSELICYSLIQMKILLWLVLTISFAIFTTFIVNRCVLHSKKKNGENKLGKAMVNMERACIFGDYINFYEFTKYAIREAMGLPRGQAGLNLSIDDILTKLKGREVPESIRATILEIYEISAKINEEADEDGNLP